MSARAIPAELEPEIIDRSLKGESLRRISEWLLAEKEITASHAAVSGVLQRHGAKVVTLLENEHTRQLGESLPDTLAALDEVDAHYRAITLAGLSDAPPPKLTAALQALKARQSLLLWKLRVCGVHVFSGGRPLPVARPAEPVIAAPKVSTPAPKPAPAAAPSPSRNGPCPCGSGEKYKRCHGDPKRAPEAAKAA